MAAALTGYDEDNEGFIGNRKYGELVFEYYGWGNDQDFALEGGRIGSHPCTKEEVGIEQGPGTKAFPIHETSIFEVEQYLPNFLCMDEGHPNLWGDYDSSRA